MLFTSFSIKASRSEIFDYYLRRYADCMAGGNRKQHDCHNLRLRFESETNPVVEVVYLILLAFSNFVSLPFVIQSQTMKNSIRKALQRLSNFVNTK